MRCLGAHPWLPGDVSVLRFLSPRKGLCPTQFLQTHSPQVFPVLCGSPAILSTALTPWGLISDLLCPSPSAYSTHATLLLRVLHEKDEHRSLG